jgi:hypothetical protein
MAIGLNAAQSEESHALSRFARIHGEALNFGSGIAEHLNYFRISFKENLQVWH